MTAALEVRNIGHSFGDRVALDDVSFEVRRGEVFGLLGPNGAGKTTLMSIVSGLRAARSGEVRVDGDILRPRHRELKRRLGLVPQELALYPELTAAENLRFFGELYRVPHLDGRIAEILADIGLTERADQRAATFSGGMQRRLNFGIALVHGPGILLLDEPTTGVDPQSRNHLFEGIRRINAAGTTIVYTSHYMEEVEALCDRIGIIDHGRLIACDTLPNLLARLPSVVRFRVDELPASWDGLPGVTIANGEGRIEGPDASEAAIRLTTWCGSRGVRLTHIQMETPTLESVFLHLTGKTLRDE